jgi:hypothetical protein
MQQIRTTGDLREFLGGVLIGIREGTVDKDQAMSIAKVASQINLSVSVEVNASIQLRRLGEGDTVAGSMLLIQSDSPAPPKLLPTDQDGLIWCDQCDMRVEPKDATGCKSKHCKAKVAQ